MYRSQAQFRPDIIAVLYLARRKFVPNEPSLIDRMRSNMPPIDKLIGFTVASIEPGKVVVELETDERHTNPMGTLHGGVLCDIADAAMGYANASLLQPGETF